MASPLIKFSLLAFSLGIALGILILLFGGQPLTDGVSWLEDALVFDNQASTTPIVLYNFVEVIDSCGPHFEGVCASVHSQASATSSVVGRLRTGVVLKVEQVSSDGDWYKIAFDEWLRYPERVAGSWYIASSSARLFQDKGEAVFVPGKTATSTKRILVDRSTQTLSAYDGDVLFMQESISTGLDFTPTPRGVFTVYKKTPTRYMQGPLPGISDQYYDLPGVPWNLYFTEQGGVIHGAYWHNSFGKQWSHGCVNVATLSAQKLYEWADVGTSVTVRD